MTVIEQEVSHGMDDVDFISASEVLHSLNQPAIEVGVSPVKKPVLMEWIYIATGHGKGPCDGVGGLLKHLATKYNLSNLFSTFIRSF